MAALEYTGVYSHLHLSRRIYATFKHSSDKLCDHIVSFSPKNIHFAALADQLMRRCKHMLGFCSLMLMLSFTGPKRCIDTAVVLTLTLALDTKIICNNVGNTVQKGFFGKRTF